MSEARKCNRCQKCFDPMDMNSTSLMTRFPNPTMQNPKDIRENRITGYLYDDLVGKYVDLCPHCTENYILFMNGYPLAVENGYFDAPDVKTDSGFA